MNALRLLPDEDVSVRCAEFSRQLGVDPGGTALALDEIVVADVPLPWPKPVFTRVGFETVPAWVEAAREAGRKVRVLGAIPLDDIEQGRVVVHRRDFPGAPRLERIEHRVGRDDVADLLRSLLVEGSDSSPGTEFDAPQPEAELLICTQGSHDRCCGSAGTRFALEMEALRPGLLVRRVSHTGGHRFAPTGVTLPDGRMWGRLDAEQMAAILDRSVPPSAVTGLCRGWTGAAQGPAQMAERAVLAHVDDWAIDTRPRHVTVVGESDGNTTVSVVVDDRRWEVDVVVGRDVPTIACGAPGGLPAKPGVEYLVREVRGPTLITPGIVRTTGDSL